MSLLHELINNLSPAEKATYNKQVKGSDSKFYLLLFDLINEHPEFDNEQLHSRLRRFGYKGNIKSLNNYLFNSLTQFLQNQQEKFTVNEDTCNMMQQARMFYRRGLNDLALHTAKKVLQQAENYEQFYEVAYARALINRINRHNDEMEEFEKNNNASMQANYLRILIIKYLDLGVKKSASQRKSDATEIIEILKAKNIKWEDLISHSAHISYSGIMATAYNILNDLDKSIYFWRLQLNYYDEHPNLIEREKEDYWRAGFNYLETLAYFGKKEELKEFIPHLLLQIEKYSEKRKYSLGLQFNARILFCHVTNQFDEIEFLYTNYLKERSDEIKIFDFTIEKKMIGCWLKLKKYDRALDHFKNIYSNPEFKSRAYLYPGIMFLEMMTDYLNNYQELIPPKIESLTKFLSKYFDKGEAEFKVLSFFKKLMNQPPGKINTAILDDAQSWFQKQNLNDIKYLNGVSWTFSDFIKAVRVKKL